VGPGQKGGRTEEAGAPRGRGGGTQEPGRSGARAELDVAEHDRARHEALQEVVRETDYEVLAPVQNPGHELIIYRAADAASQAALDALTAQNVPRYSEFHAI
jgi:hypothetical protein